MLNTPPGISHVLYLAVHAEAGLGFSGWCHSAECIMVGDRSCSDCLYIKRELWSSLVWFLMASVSQSLGFR